MNLFFNDKDEIFSAKRQRRSRCISYRNGSGLPIEKQKPCHQNYRLFLLNSQVFCTILKFDLRILYPAQDNSPPPFSSQFSCFLWKTVMSWLWCLFQCLYSVSSHPIFKSLIRWRWSILTFYHYIFSKCYSLAINLIYTTNWIFLNNHPLGKITSQKRL